MNSNDLPKEQASSAATTRSRYRPVAALAEGGMGVVYLAVNRGKSGFRKLVVLKELKPELARDPQFLTMFLDEARLASRLSHPSVVQTLEVGDEGDRHFLVMEYLDGQPLDKVLARIGRSRFPLTLHIKILCDVLAGLHYAHELADYDGRPLHVVHRDVSPPNVFVTYDGQVKLVDFGIAKAMGSTHETRAGMLKGKIAYMPAEQAKARAVDRRADIYAVGVMLWEALAGRRMWPKTMNEVEILASAVVGELPKLAEHAPNAPSALARVAEKALALDPARRYARADEMQADLDAYLASQSRVPQSRDLVDTLSKGFAEERTKMRALIDARIRSLEQNDDLEADGSHRAAPLMPLNREDTGYPSISIGDSDTETPSPLAMGRTAHSLGGSSLSASALSSVTGAPPAPAARPRMGVVFAGLVGILAMGAIAGVRARPWQKVHGEQKAAETAGAPSASVSATVANVATAVPLAAVPTVQLAVAANPPNAKICVDGIPVQGNPYSGAYPKDFAHHGLTVEASGFETKRTDVVFDRDMSVAISLDKRSMSYVPSPPRPAPPRAVPTPEVQPSAAPSPTPKASEPESRGPARPIRSLYGGDPYAK